MRLRSADKPVLMAAILLVGEQIETFYPVPDSYWCIIHIIRARITLLVLVGNCLSFMGVSFQIGTPLTKGKTWTAVAERSADTALDKRYVGS
jgi:hypothetical protein